MNEQIKKIDKIVRDVLGKEIWAAAGGTFPASHRKIGAVKKGMKLRYALSLPERHFLEKNERLYNAVIAALTQFPKLEFAKETILIPDVDEFACVAITVPCE